MYTLRITINWSTEQDCLVFGLAACVLCVVAVRLPGRLAGEELLSPVCVTLDK